MREKRDVRINDASETFLSPCLPSFFSFSSSFPFRYILLIIFLPLFFLLVSFFPLFSSPFCCFSFLSFLPLFYSPGFFLIFPSSLFYFLCYFPSSRPSIIFFFSSYFTSLPRGLLDNKVIITKWLIVST